jgi:hypothetical protein
MVCLTFNPFMYFFFFSRECYWDHRALRRPVGILHVMVLHAMKFKKKYLLGASDPYMKLKLTDDKMH